MKTLVIGAAIIDILMKVKKLPGRGGDVICDNRQFAVGGCAYNVANIMQILGVDYDLFVPIGNGMYAETIKKELIKNKHKILIEDSSDDNGYSIALIEPDGERTFITYAGLEGQIKKEWFDLLNWDDYQNIYFEGYRMASKDSAILLNYLSKYKNKNLYFCPGPMINEIDTKKIICDLKPKLHLNDKELLDFMATNDIKLAIKNLYALNQNEIFVTLGKDGMIYYNGANILEIAGEKVAKIVDTTGAGDTHIGTLISAIAKGKDIKTSCHLANIVASQIVQIAGTKLDDKTTSKLKEAFLNV